MSLLAPAPVDPRTLAAAVPLAAGAPDELDGAPELALLPPQAESSRARLAPAATATEELLRMNDRFDGGRS